jgi:RHS repeat-associated protein
MLLSLAFSRISAQTLPDRGFLPTRSYDPSSTDEVNLQTGTLIYQVPLYSFPSGAGGQSWSIGLSYDSSIYDPDPYYPYTNIYAPNLYSSETSLTGGGWQWAHRYQLGVRYPDNHIYVVFPDGSHHTFFLRNALGDAANTIYPYMPNGNESIDPSGGDSNSTCTYHLAGRTLVYYSDDSTFLRLELQLGTSPNCNTPPASPSLWTVYFPNGTRVFGSGVLGIDAASASTQIVDRNGNSISIAPVVLCSVPGAGCTPDTPSDVLTDQLGRIVTIMFPASAGGSVTDLVCAPGHLESGSSTACNDMTVANPVGQLHWRVNWDSYTSTDQSYYNNAYPSTPVGAPGGLFVTNIGLPSANGETLQYSFTYTVNPGWGELKSATTPYGLTTSYQYWCSSTSSGCLASNFRPTQVQPNVQVQQRTQAWTDPLGVARNQTWSYSQGRGLTISAVTAPDGGVTLHTPCDINSLFWPSECTTTLPNGDTVSRTWQWQCLFSGYGNQQIQQEVRTVNTSQGNGGPQASSKNYTYDRNGNPLTTAESAFFTNGRTTTDSYAISTGSQLIAAPTTTTAPPTNCAPHTPAGVMIDYNAYWSSSNDTTSPLPGWTLNARTSHEVSDLNGSSTWTYGYDSPVTTANVTSETNGAVVIGHSYDGSGNLISTTDGNGVVTKYTYAAAACADGASYSSFAYPDTVVRDFGGTLQRATTQTWDCKTGLLKSSTDPNNVKTSYSYDLIGRKTLLDEAVGTAAERTTSINLSESNSGSGSLTPLTVTAYHNLFSSTDTPVVTTQQFDQRGVLTMTQNPAGAITQLYGKLSIPADGFTYEAVSNPFLSTTDATMGWTRRTYDTSGRLTAVGHFSGAAPPCPFAGSSTPTTCGGTAAPDSSQSTTYDGSVSTFTDEAGVARTNTMDGLDRLHSVQEGCAGCLTTYTYDFGDRLATVTQGSQTRTFTYDALGRLGSAQNPESGTSTFTYDNNGNVHSRQTPIGTATYSYDHLNRLIGKTYLDSTPPVTYCYDGITTAPGCSGSPTGALLMDRLTMVQNAKSTTRFSQYDEEGQVILSQQVTGSQTFPFTYAYNRLGGLQTMTYPSGRTVTMGFDNAGRISGVTYQATGLQYASSLSYAANNAISGLLFGNGLTESTTFNTRFQPTQIKAGNLLTLTLTYGSSPSTNNGNLASQTIAQSQGTWTQSYTYDGVNRLACANETAGAALLTCGTGTPNWWLTFGYDNFGNRWLSNNPSSAGVPISPFTPGSSTNYDAANHLNIQNSLYDGAGNQKQIGGFQFVYDSENRMTSSVFTSTPTNQTTTQYDYDGDGRRVTKTVNGQATTYVYDAAGQLAAEYGPPTDAGTKYLTSDHLGSTRLITDTGGLPARCYDYLPFGEEIANGTAGRTANCFGSAVYPGSPDIENVKFTGKERDAETGLDFFGARYFSGAQGRFTSPDAPFNDQHPEDPQSWNLYAYARGNPLLYTDPHGTYVCGAATTGEQCDAIEAARVRAQADADRLRERYGEDSRQYKDAQRAITALGTQGVDNGVTVTVGAVGAAWRGQTDVGGNVSPATASNPNGQNIEVTLAAGVVAEGGAGLASTLAHEGSHVADGSEWVSSGFAAAKDPTLFATEYRAYNVSVNILGAENVAPFSMGPVGAPKVLLAPGFPIAINGPQIEKLLAIPGGYGVTRMRPGDPVFDRHHMVRRR